MRRLALVGILLMLGFAAQAQPVVSYITPDAGAPGMCVAVEFISPYNKPQNFDTKDGTLSPGEIVRLVVASDSAFVRLGPSIVSNNGMVIQQMLLIEESAPDGTTIQLQVVNSAGQSAPVNFSVRLPGHLGTLTGGGVIGQAPLVPRSVRNTMIVDSMILQNGIYSCPTGDPDLVTPGNQAFLPLRILSKGPIRLINATLSANGLNATTGVSGGNGGPGGGGGGGGYPAVGGNGFTGGGGDATNLACGGLGSGGVPTDPTGGQSMTGISGGDGEHYVSSGDDGGGGGTGHPFGHSGTISWNQPSVAGGFGGGSGGGSTSSYSADYGGGGGGFATDGTKGDGAGDNHGRANGNELLVPLAGGSGGGAGNVTYVSFFGGSKGGSGGGGGGAIELTSFSTLTMGSGSSSAITSNGGSGSNAVPASFQSAAAGGGGSGGTVSIGARDSIVIGANGAISVIGGSGGTSSNSNSNGGTGGLGRVRIDGYVSNAVGSSSNYYSSNKDFTGPSVQRVVFSKDSFEIIGHGCGWDNSSDTLPVQVWTAWPNESTWYLIDVTPSKDPVSHSWKWSSGKLEMHKGAADTEIYIVALQADTSGVLQMMTHTSGMIAKIPGPAKVLSKTTVIDFGKIAVGKCSHDTTFQIYSVGKSDLDVNQLSITGADAGQFLLKSPTPPKTVKIGDSLSVTLSFCPTVLKCPMSDTLHIGTNDVQVLVQLKGCAVQPMVSVPDTINFGRVQKDSCKDTTFTIANTGTGPLTITRFILPNPAFTAINGVPITIAENSNFTLHIRFCPTDTIAYQTPDSINSDNPTAVVVILKGDARPLPLKKGILTMKSPFNFGHVTKGTCKDSSFFVYNTGNDTLLVDAPSITNNNFILLSPSTGFVLAPGDTLRIGVRFCSPGPNAWQGSLNFHTHLPTDQAVQLLAYTGEGILNIPPVIDFGTVSVGACKDTDIVVWNSAQDTLVVTGAKSFQPPFSYQSADPLLLAPGASGKVKLRFCPTDTNTVSQITRLDTNHTTSTTFMVRGNGERVSLLVNPTGVDFGCLRTGVTSTSTVHIDNKGTGVLKLISAKFLVSKNFTIAQYPHDSVAPGASDSVKVSVSSITPDTAYAILELQYQGIAPIDIPITGRLSSPPKITALDTNVSFSSVNVGDSSKDTCLRITNYSCVGIDLGTMSIVGTGSGSFKITSVSNATILADSQFATICVRFVPGSSGNQTAQLQVTNSAGTSTIATLSGSGKGQPVAVQLTLDTVSGRPGQIVQTAVRTLNDVTPAAITSLTFRVTFDPMQLDMKTPQASAGNSIAPAGGSAAPVFSVKQYSFGDREVTATYSSPLSGKTLVATLPFEILLPSTSTAAIHLVNASFGTSPATLSSVSDGQIRIEQCDTSEQFALKPSWIKVAQNSPNPFNPRTAIELEIGSPGHVEIQILNELGERVLVPFDDNVEAGRKKIELDAGALPSGVYHYITVWSDGISTLRDEKTMIVVK